MLFSLNLGDSVTLTLAPKAEYLFTVISSSSGTAYGDGLFLGGGVNLQIRPSHSFAITPGFDWQRLVSNSIPETFFSIGIGLSFGAMPDYGPDMTSKPTMMPPPPGSAPPPPPSGSAPTAPPGY